MTVVAIGLLSDIHIQSWPAFFPVPKSRGLEQISVSGVTFWKSASLLAVNWIRGLPNQSHTSINKLLVSRRFRSSQTGTPHNHADFESAHQQRST
jgi:hypothetical protein